MMSKLKQSIFGPTLYRIHASRGTLVEEGRNYVPNAMENGADQVVRWIRLCYTISYWTSPFLIHFLYKRAYFTPDGAIALLKLLSSVILMFYGSKFVRGIGRYRNPDYYKFLSVLENAGKNYTVENKQLLREYDFDFSDWPVDFRWDETEDVGKKRSHVDSPKVASRSGGSFIKTLPCNILSYIVAHTFGRRMIYPGTTGLVSTLMGSMLLEGRSKLVETYNGTRAKLLSSDGNSIDTMVIDRRKLATSTDDNSKTLVITCEGNSGFYEVGCMLTPLDAGYSVLGWNHPGFGGSTGVPFPDQEQNGIDVVIQYAIHKLGFQLKDIVIFAWSIGGYTASWAAMNYPELKYVILDATFDDLVPLAVARMPQSWRSLVTMTVRNYMNLNIAEQLKKFPGPVFIIRRSRDEMITTSSSEVPDPCTNRGNNLLTKLLQYRYPKIFNEQTLPELDNWLCSGPHVQSQLISEYSIHDDICDSTILSYIQENGDQFPMMIGEDFDIETKIQYMLFFATRHLQEFDSTHCTPLPIRFFRQPWKAGLLTQRLVPDED